MSAFGDAIVEVTPNLQRYALKLTRDRTAAEELVQDTVTRALSRLHLFELGTDIRAWLFTILHNEHVNNLRATRRHAEVISPVSVDDFICAEDRTNAFAVDGNQDWHVLAREIGDAIGELSEETRAVLLMVARDGLNYDAVAQRLDIPVGTVRSRLSRGRARLREFIGDSLNS
jgi:RNA polymerase sigma-70 factor (ECF subfamily)